MYCNTGAMPPGMELETPEKFNKSNEYPEALIPVSIAKELSNNNLTPIIRELHNISQELHTLNQILRNKLR